MQSIICSVDILINETDKQLFNYHTISYIDHLCRKMLMSNLSHLRKISTHIVDKAVNIAVNVCT